MPNPEVSYPRDADTPVSHLPFSPCVVVGNLVFVSGQASVDKTGKIISGDIESEFRLSMQNVEAVLKTAGTDLAHVVQTRNYVRDENDLPKYNELYAEYFTDAKPARTTITQCLPQTLRYEIECIAVLPQ
ncbi:RidA family protein [Allorhodopirellula solitaria]|uniref:Enamine/imine deaminase n=1 Tax=Allorhodopirellula solitaria TaxID=2527987 RepID=A0A5C5XRQ1_9BACT|nr:RidA family protein [Allorhodopirellula solitaria]TWT65329.1 Enamine/imine deaminase [Allorhodopirellula solitaria]